MDSVLYCNVASPGLSITPSKSSSRPFAAKFWDSVALAGASLPENRFGLEESRCDTDGLWQFAQTRPIPVFPCPRLRNIESWWQMFVQFAGSMFWSDCLCSPIRFGLLFDEWVSWQSTHLEVLSAVPSCSLSELSGMPPVVLA